MGLERASFIKKENKAVAVIISMVFALIAIMMAPDVNIKLLWSPSILYLVGIAVVAFIVFSIYKAFTNNNGDDEDSNHEDRNVQPRKKVARKTTQREEPREEPKIIKEDSIILHRLVTPMRSTSFRISRCSFYSGRINKQLNKNELNEDDFKTLNDLFKSLISHLHAANSFVSDSEFVAALNEVKQDDLKNYLLSLVAEMINLFSEIPTGEIEPIKSNWVGLSNLISQKLGKISQKISEFKSKL